MSRPRFRLGSLLLLAGAFGAGALQAVEAPRLVVLLVVDQLRADYLERFRDQYEGGFKWLLDHGAQFPSAAFRHSSTVTAAGHATVSTGLHPSSHGIVGNSWREAARGPVYCVEDETYLPVGGPGEGRSPRNLLAETIGDRLKARYPGARAYSVSTKDRSAILLAGKRADAALWFEPDCGCLVTSSYYADALPAWAAAVNAEGPAGAYAGREWTRLLDSEPLYRRLARSDAFEGEGDGVPNAFPHRLPAAGFEGDLARTPFSDEITIEAALAALGSGELGSDDEPDLLALGLSATDSIGHRYGPFSQEAMDNHLRLDRALGRFLEALDAAVGLERVLIALTADHGALPLVEHLRERGVEARRFSTEGLWTGARKAVDECGAGPASETVAQASGRQLYWSENALRERGANIAEASACVADWLRLQAGVEAVIVSGRGGGPARPLFRNAHYPGRSAHVELHLRQRFYIGGATGTGHGTAHLYDRQVPVLLAGPGIAPGVYRGPAGPEDIAPTLGALLGIEMPLEHDTRVLREILEEAAP